MARRRIKRVGPYKSKWEVTVAGQIEALGFPVKYEKTRVIYLVPERVATYTPDFQIDEKTFIESKGKFDADDRKKHLLLKEQHGPHGYKFYIVFMNAYQKLSKKSKTTYAEWCEKNGIEWSHKEIKKEWLASANKPRNSKKASK